MPSQPLTRNFRILIQDKSLLTSALSSWRLGILKHPSGQDLEVLVSPSRCRRPHAGQRRHVKTSKNNQQPHIYALPVHSSLNAWELCELDAPSLRLHIGHASNLRFSKSQTPLHTAHKTLQYSVQPPLRPYLSPLFASGSKKYPEVPTGPHGGRALELSKSLQVLAELLAPWRLPKRLDGCAVFCGHLMHARMTLHVEM